VNPAQTKRFRLGHAVDGQEHVELALGEAQLADVAEIRRICRRDVDISNGGFDELAAFGRLVRVFGQPGDAVPFQAPVQACTGELGDAVAQAAHHVIERQQGPAAELDHRGLFGQREHGAVRGSRPHRRVVGRRPGAPFGDGGPAQPVAAG